jgi:hypothetical protein
MGKESTVGCPTGQMGQKIAFNRCEDGCFRDSVVWDEKAKILDSRQ